jgi:hypothetical protein
VTQARTYGTHAFCILRNRTTFEPIPIQSVDVAVNVVHTLAEITVKQLYHNATVSPLECIFEFSVGDNAVLSSLAVVVEGKKIKASVQEKEEAFATYDDAISAGSGAYLLESTEKSNQYKLNVGNLPPSKQAEVHFAYVVPLTAAHDGWLFSIPPSIFPSHRSYVSSIEGRVDVGEEAQIVVLSEHPIKTEPNGFKYTREEPAFGLASEISFSIKPQSMSAHKDTSAATAQELTAPGLVVEHDLREPTLFTTMLDFRPVFASNKPEMASDYEFVVVADCSGAMYGAKMQQQINALKLLVHSLPSGCKFNLVATGLNYSLQWPSSVVLDEENLNRALWAIEHLQAEQGEFRLKPALTSIYLRRDYLRNLCIFVLTSLDYSSESRATIKLVSDNASRNSRLFAIGFGDEVDTELLNALTFAGRGRAHFVKDDDFVDGILFQQLVAAFAPRVRDIKVTWNLNEDAKAVLIDQAPLHIPITASGASTLVYGLFEVPIPEGVEIPEIKDDFTAAAEVPSPTAHAASSATGDKIVASSSTHDVNKKKDAAESAPADAVTTTPKSARKSKKTVAKGAEVTAPADVAPPKLLAGLHYPIKSVTVTGVGPDEQELRWEIPVSEASFRGMSNMIRSVAATKVCNEYVAPKSVRAGIMSPEQIKQKVIEISTRCQVISKYTSFVAVEERTGEATEAAMKKVEIAANQPVSAATETQIPSPPPINRIPHIPYHPPIRRPILPIKHWVPPPPPATQNVAPQKCLTLSFDRAANSFAPSFSSDKARKKMSKEKSDHVSSYSAYGGSAPSPVAYDGQSTSQLGFALRSQEYEEDALYEENRLESLLQQAPYRFKLEPPTLTSSSSSSVSGLVLDEVTSFKRTSNAEMKDATREPNNKRESNLSEPSSLSEVSLARTPMPPRNIAPRAPGGASGAAPPSGSQGPPPPPPPGFSQQRRRASFSSSASSDEENDDEGHDSSVYRTRGGRVLPAKSLVSGYADEQLVPNKLKLEYKQFAAVSPAPERHVVAMQAPRDWNFLERLHSSAAPSLSQSSTASTLRTIVTSQHADGSWDLQSVAVLLKLDPQAIVAANPLRTSSNSHHKKKSQSTKDKVETESKGEEKKSDKKGSKTPKSARKGPGKKHEHEKSATDAEQPAETHLDDAETQKPDAIAMATSASSSSIGTQQQDVSKQALGSEAQPEAQLSPQDIWATAILLAHLKRQYDSEKNFWTFVALKVAALLAKAVPDEAARKSLLKKAKNYLDSLPVGSAAPASP